MSVAQNDETVAVHDELWPQRVQITSDKLHVLWSRDYHGRIECGTELALEPGRVIVSGGRWRVKDEDGKWQTVNGTCTCRDYKDQVAPQGFCKHRFAALIVRDAQAIPDEELVVEISTTEQEPEDDDILDPGQGAWEQGLPRTRSGEDGPGPRLAALADLEQYVARAVQDALAHQPPALPEAPASVNLFLTIEGRDCQLTLRDSDEARLLQRLRAVLGQYPLPPQGEPATSQEPVEGEPPQAEKPTEPKQVQCDACHKPMKWREGKGGSKGWWSHKVGDVWCRGKGPGVWVP